MDARITKQRLGNLLSYDWLKILGTIAAAVALLYVLFTVITTRPTTEQTYTVFTYDGLNIGAESSTLTDRLEGKFSYDILDITMQNFDGGMMGEQAMSARRGMLEGDAIIVSDYAEEEGGATSLSLLCEGYGGYNEALGTMQGFYNIPGFLTDTETYLAGFFGVDLGGEPNADKVREAFFRRNSSDKRFKTAAQKEAGVAQERARLLSIRDNYLLVKAAFNDGSLYTVAYEGAAEVKTGDGAQTVPYTAEVGVGLGNLTGLNKLVFYYQGETVSTEKLVLVFFNNGERNEETKYENLAFLRYLLETYAPVHS